MSPVDLAPLAPYFHQVSYVVPDLAPAMSRFHRLFGVSFGSFEIAVGPDHFTLHGHPAAMRIAVASGMMGPTEIELIQPVGGDTTVYTEHLEKHGPLVAHHLGFDVPDYDTYEAFFLEKGFPILQKASSGIPAPDDHDSGIYDAAYFDLRPAGLTIIEISQVKRYPVGSAKRR